MPRKILATVLEVYCPSCGKCINIRMESGQEQRKVICWNCDNPIIAENGFGENNVRVSSQNRRIRYTIIWQEEP